MLRYILILTLALFLAPYTLNAAPVQESEGVIEEPDEGGSTAFENPRNADMTGNEEEEEEAKPAPGTGKDKKDTTPPPVAEKKPGEGLETGFNSVILQGLNKVTGRASRLEAAIGSTVRFGTLEIIPRSCWKSAPGDRPENAVLLEIFEIRQGEPPSRIFLGWMFSSSPGLASLENPFYDITVITCGRSEGEKP